MPVHGTLRPQHDLLSSVASGIAEAPGAPESLTRLNVELARGIFAASAGVAGRIALAQLRDALFKAEGREKEARALWHESLATAAYAELLCDAMGASIGVASFGGLLHRAGDASLLCALSRSEAKSGTRLEPLARSRVTAAESAACAARLAREWSLPAAVAACVTDWQRCGALEHVSPEAKAVYCGHLLALELLQPQFCAPGALPAALGEQGCNAGALARVRSSDLRVLRLSRSLD